MTRYKLSLEEFLEFNQNSLPTQSIASFVAMIFIAVAVGAFGGVLTYAVDPGSKLTASIFCWLSLALFIAAFCDLRPRTARRKQRAIGELRAKYERFHCGEQTFAFDGRKWMVESGGGKRESSWESLLSAAEWPNVITLSARDQLFAVVPKRVLLSEELQALRRIAIAPTVLTWDSKVSLTDFLFTEVASLWRRHPFLMTEAHVGGLLWFGMIATGVYHETGPGTYVGWTLAGIVLFLTITAQFWYFLIKYQTSHKELRKPWRVGLSEKGLYIQTAQLEFFSAWASFRNTREAARCFLLYVHGSFYYVLPKRCIPQTKLGELRQLMQTNFGRA